MTKRFEDRLEWGYRIIVQIDEIKIVRSEQFKVGCYVFSGRRGSESVDGTAGYGVPPGVADLGAKEKFRPQTMLSQPLARSAAAMLLIAFTVQMDAIPSEPPIGVQATFVCVRIR